ncbi:hydrolase [Longimycelium tulufanense]|uniref:Hydrolase n=1 Tax=Longimycelium tulufanense TaxID=907463 RepID=A0A8J3FSZ2_9PSEU|nr:alpha/beta hydrolase [Longimycelium tulufanense]GGM33861.1 hydrolase [Longimycelium tulufanense]
MFLRRRFGVAAVIAALTGGLALVPSSAAGRHAAGVDGPVQPRLHWSACGDGFECATAQVPLDYRDPRGKLIDLAVIRLPASDQGLRIGSLFVNFGGPGSSGVSRLRERARWPWLFSPELRARFDLVSWDTRAVGRSTAVRCFETKAEQRKFFATFPELPGDRAGEPGFFARSRELVERCRDRAGELLPHMSTVNTARDLDLLRMAVGDRKLSYHGISYGTHVGAVYANLFPHRVRALAFDGSMDFAGNATGRTGNGFREPVDVRQDVARGIAETFTAFLDECAAAGPRCAFSSGDPHEKWRILAERARRHPITITEPDGSTATYTYSAVVNAAASLADPDDWPAVARTLQRLHEASGVPSVAAAGAPYVDNRPEAFHAIQCADSWVPRQEATYSRLAITEDRRVPYFGRIAVFGMMSCAYWPRESVRPYLGPWHRRIPPVLVINSRFDPATPLHGARDGLRELSRGRLLVVEGAGHTTMLVRSTCAEKVKRGYLVSGALPAAGASCPVDRRPFEPIH